MRDSTIIIRADVYDELPSTSADNVMLSADSSPRLQSPHSPNYVELPEEPRAGKITPGGSSSPSPSTPSPRASKSDNRSSPDEEEAIEEAVPIVRSSLPSPEPRPELHNGYGDRLDGVPTNGSLKPQPQPARDVDDDSCLIKCVYFTQQCCECVII